jgi:hypothetical protein
MEIVIVVDFANRYVLVSDLASDVAKVELLLVSTAAR